MLFRKNDESEFNEFWGLPGEDDEEIDEGRVNERTEANADQEPKLRKRIRRRRVFRMILRKQLRRRQDVRKQMMRFLTGIRSVAIHFRLIMNTVTQKMMCVGLRC